MPSILICAVSVTSSGSASVVSSVVSAAVVSSAAAFVSEAAELPQAVKDSASAAVNKALEMGGGKWVQLFHFYVSS